ncbi:DUF488 domain-containing protein [Leucobacter sp. GX24907]
MDIALKRVYEPPAPEDHCRVLVDRLWPRGISKEQAHLDLWAKNSAPSAELRRSWHADPQGRTDAGFEAFSAHYRDELAESPAREALDELLALAQEHQRVTLVYGAKDPEMNHAVVLREVLLRRGEEARTG